MAEMGLGYGSEFQLLRFLGHHRHELEGSILRNTKINPDLTYNMDWLDYPKDKTRKSLDGEYTGIDFLPPKLQKKISENWKKYWPKNGQNWDAILYCSPLVPNSPLEDQWIIVEAKAHIKELESPCQAKDKESVKKIESAFEATQHFNIKPNNSWFKQYYQLANRLAFINFLLDNGIQCSLLNIYFINGWANKPEKNVLNIGTWKEAINAEYSYLGINNNAKKYISEIFVEC